MNETIRETADSLLAKQAKIDLAEKAAYVDDLTQRQDAQRESIYRYEELKVFGNPTQPIETTEEEDSDVPRIIICDDYHVDNKTQAQTPPNQKSWGTTAALVLTAALVGYTLVPKAKAPEPIETPTISAEDQNTTYSLEFSGD